MKNYNALSEKYEKIIKLKIYKIINFYKDEFKKKENEIKIFLNKLFK